MKNRMMILSGLFVAFTGLFCLSGCSGMEEEMDRFVAEAQFETPDIASMPDGSYSGTFRSGIVSAKVKVTITAGTISDIRIVRHFNGQGESAEKIIEDVIAEQSVEVDIISGATYSSKVILKAIETALTETD